MPPRKSGVKSGWWKQTLSEIKEGRAAAAIHGHLFISLNVRFTPTIQACFVRIHIHSYREFNNASLFTQNWSHFPFSASGQLNIVAIRFQSSQKVSDIFDADYLVVECSENFEKNHTRSLVYCARFLYLVFFSKSFYFPRKLRKTVPLQNYLCLFRSRYSRKSLSRFLLVLKVLDG